MHWLFDSLNFPFGTKLQNLTASGNFWGYRLNCKTDAGMTVQRSRVSQQSGANWDLSSWSSSRPVWGPACSRTPPPSFSLRASLLGWTATTASLSSIFSTFSSPPTWRDWRWRFAVTTAAGTWTGELSRLYWSVCQVLYNFPESPLNSTLELLAGNT